MADKHVVVIGAGPGGLTAAMILAKRGYRVTVFEREEKVGGRNRELTLGEYRFDTGPTFLMMKFILDEVFAEAGKRSADYLEFVKLDPMYRLSFADKIIEPTTDREKMAAQLETLFPGSAAGLERFYRTEKNRYDRMYPCLQKDYSFLSSLFCKPLLKALPHLALSKSLYGNLAGYFREEDCRIAFTFQAKYLGMSPWECPAAFTIIPFIEHEWGIYHVIGGLSRISEAMAVVVGENGGEIRLATKVDRIVVNNRRACGVRLSSGEEVPADAVVINADFGHAMTTLFDDGVLRKYSPAKVKNMKYSCSTFMLYLGIHGTCDEPHHNIIFANDYRHNVEDIVAGRKLPDDMSVYVRNASLNDPTLAPAGHSAIYVLVPAPNNAGGITWNDRTRDDYRARVLARIGERTGLKDLCDRIEVEKIVTPADWENEYSVYNGATFNLAHNIGQMLYFRPRNKFEEIAGCYLVGGGTHPGSGLPTIYESGRISANLLCRCEE